MGYIINRHKREALSLFRMTLAFGLLGWVSYVSPDIAKVIYGAISNSYVGVTVWVALTLGVFYTLESGLKIDFGTLMVKHKKWQVVFAALLGGFPGCGGAIIVTTQYVKKQISFGALVATLTATMGDAAFLLIAAELKTALVVISVGIVVGIISGYITDLFPLPKWLAKGKACNKSENKETEEILKSWFWSTTDKVWLILLVPGLFLTAANSINTDANEWFSFIYYGFADDLSVFMGVFTFSIFFSCPSENNPMDILKIKPSSSRRVVAETSFISAWVVLGFVVYDMSIYLSGLDLKTLFSTIAPIVPFIGVAIGWLPGCGPQIVVTTLYINGIIPFSALMGNAISNDGDALFPALVIAPRAGILATVYSTVPAIIVAYGFYFYL